MAKKAYIGVPSYKVIIERNMTYSSGNTWSWGMNTTNEVNWTKGETYVCDVTIDGVTYPNLTFSPDVGSSWFAVYPEVGDTVFEVYVATNNQLYDYGLGLDTATSHTILLSNGDFNGVARKIKKGYVGIPAIMDVPTGRAKYNNMDLPTVPEWDSTTYPYAYISYSAIEGYRFLVCSANLQYVLAQGKCTPVSDASYMYATLWNKTTGTWSSWSSVRSATANSTYLTAPTWANTAIPYSDGSATLISATEPTVFYEKKEIGVARKIKRGYVGIGGVARPFWTGGELTYYGEVEALSKARRMVNAESIGDYAIFLGGMSSTNVDAYDKSLIRTSATALSSAKFRCATTVIGGYALFGGGNGSGTTSTSTTVITYDNSLTQGSATSLSGVYSRTAATSVGNYAIFAGSYNPNSSSDKWKSGACAYDTDLTRTIPTSLSAVRSDLMASTVGNHAIFAGGQKNSSNFTKVVDAYDDTLTRTTITSLAVNRGDGGATTVGKYALFVGGRGSTVDELWDCADVEVYDENLTKTTIAELTIARLQPVGVTLSDFAVFAGGSTSRDGESNIVDAYDDFLTKVPVTNLNTARHDHDATVVGDFALFGGGYAESTIKSVEAYTI